MSDAPVIHSDHFEPLEATFAEHAAKLQAVKQTINQPVDQLFESDPTMMYRFLKGEKFDVQKTVNHINEVQTYRSTHNLNDIRAKAVKLAQHQFPHYDRIIKYYPHSINHGVDKKGQPLSIERLGHSNPTLLCKSVTLDQLIEYHFYHMENKGALFGTMSLENGKLMRACKILDLEGLGRQHLTAQGLGFLKQIVTISQDNYPEMLGSLFIINAPWVFNLAMKAIKPLLHEQTLDKIHVLGSDYQSVLKQYIPEEHLPVEFGGKCHCNGGAGGSGPCIPMYDIEADMTKLSVSRGGKEVVKVNVPLDQSINQSSDQSNSKTAWQAAYEVKPESHDISVGIQFQPKSGQPIQILAHPARHSETLIDAVIVKEPGTLIFTFDNSYSRFTSKSIFYRIDIETLTGDDVGIADAIEEEERVNHIEH